MIHVVMHTGFISESMFNFYFYLAGHEEEIWITTSCSEEEKSPWLVKAIIILDWTLNLQKSIISFNSDEFYSATTLS